MKRLLLASLILFSFSTFGQRYYYGRATPGGSSSYTQLLATDVPSNFLRTNATQTAAGPTVVNGNAQDFDLGVTGNRFDNIRLASNSFSVDANGQILFIGTDFLANIGGNIDLQPTGEIRLIKGTPALGDVWVSTGTDGSGQWEARATDPTTTNGDLIQKLGGVLARLPIGSNGQFLTAQSGALTWANSVSLPVTTGTGTSAGFNLQANSLLGGNALEVSSSSVSSGTVGNFFATGTAAASNTKTALAGRTSGANATSGQSTYGIVGVNTSTGTSSTNVGVYAGASGGTTNYGLYVPLGQIRQETTNGFASPITMQSVTNNANEIFNLNSAGVGTWNLYNTSGTKTGDILFTLAGGTNPGFVIRNGGATTRYNMVHNPATDAFAIYENTINLTKVAIGGTATPSATLEVIGAGTTTSPAFKVGNSAQTTRLSILDDGTAGFQGPLLNVGNGTSAPSLRLLEPSGSGTNYTAFTVAAQAADITLTLPTAAPTANGQHLVSTTAGVMSWGVISGTATLNFDLTALNYQDLTITVTGAADGDAVTIGVPNAAVVADVTYFGWVSGTNTVSIRCSRVGGGGAADPASGTFKATLVR